MILPFHFCKRPAKSISTYASLHKTSYFPSQSRNIQFDRRMQITLTIFASQTIPSPTHPKHGPFARSPSYHFPISRLLSPTLDYHQLRRLLCVISRYFRRLGLMNLNQITVACLPYMILPLDGILMIP